MTRQREGRERVIHKSVTGYVNMSGHICGQEPVELEGCCVARWKQVTCKKCLGKKPPTEGK